MKTVEIIDYKGILTLINKKDIAGAKFNIEIKNHLIEYKGQWKHYRNIFGFKTNQVYFVGSYKNIESKTYSVIFYIKNNDGISIHNEIEIFLGSVSQIPNNDNQEAYEEAIKELDNRFKKIKELIKQ